MNRYAGTKCPHCGKVFTENDTVVVCPECGAPYHRSCFEEMCGVCQFADKHAEGFNWNTAEKKREQEEERRREDPRGTRCSRCGTLNNSQNIFCDVCGTPLHRPDDPQAPNTGETWPFRTMGYNPYTTPYGGLNPDEEIDGIPVKELAIFVGESTHYYLPKFKELKTTGRNTINWSAFLLEFLFLIYRKMYLAAGLVFVISNLLTFGVLLLVTGGNITSLTTETYSMLTMFTYAISFGILYFVGFSFNRLYMNHCFKKIRELKAKNSDQTAYYESLTKAGAVSRKAIIAICVTYILLSMAVLYLSVLFTPVI